MKKFLSVSGLTLAGVVAFNTAARADDVIVSTPAKNKDLYEFNIHAQGVDHVVVRGYSCDAMNAMGSLQVKNMIVGYAKDEFAVIFKDTHRENVFEEKLKEAMKPHIRQAAAFCGTTRLTRR